MTHPPQNGPQGDHDQAFEADRRKVLEEGLAIAKGKAQPPKVLFHYTGADGLKGIADNEYFRATNARFLNDEKELSWSFGVFLNALDGLNNGTHEDDDLVFRVRTH